MREKIALLAFAFVFGLLGLPGLPGLLTVDSERSNGSPAGRRAAQREWPPRTTPDTKFQLCQIISAAVFGFALLSAAPAHAESAKTAPPASATRGGAVSAPLPFIECDAGTYQNSSGTCVPNPTQPDPSEPQQPPSGATAKCRDGDWSFSQHHSGTCSGHGGVAEWV
jgi:hypothetical protein